ncbi:vacuolar protein sorting-associated protein 51 homolog [Patiria miniata]|uniref:Vacuolar protein sorting-associated protein 51 homolog n=1 Tax=Patiria miniata TaxID=46514 RepID=A0A914B3M2_PATMI|nr:vacuolar protein sorting-associated protein 51 homolog [Patiria miniata]
MAAPSRDDMDSEQRRRRKHGMLKMYYGLDDEAGKEATTDPIDIDGAHFDPDVYLARLMREKRLTELVDREVDMVKQIRSLDSDMQTLVYENYNKFISATDTIRKMKTDFKKMEEEMDRLATNMDAITDFSAKISGTLQDRREQITKLSSVHMLLKKLQFLFELPARLKKCIEMKAYSQAVRYYVKARAVLLQYQHMTSFHGIQQDCNEIVNDLRMILREQFSNRESSAKQLAESVDLLLQLKEPPDELCDEFLSHAKEKLDEDLAEIASQVDPALVGTQQPDSTAAMEGTDETRPAEKLMRNIPMDILEFIDSSCNSFLSNISLLIASYKELFVDRQATDSQEQEKLVEVAHAKLAEFVNSRMQQYFTHVDERIKTEKSTVDNSLLVRALDRFYRRLLATDRLVPQLKIIERASAIIAQCGHERALFYFDGLKRHFSECMTDIRQTLCAPRIAGKKDKPDMVDLLNTTTTSVVEQLKVILTNLKAFIASDITFSQTPYFRGPFCQDDVREGLLVAFFRHMYSASRDLCDGVGEKGSTTAPALILVLSRLLLDFESTTISQLLVLTDELFPIDNRRSLTQTSVLCAEAQSAAQTLLNHYVKVQGLQISQMLRKSVETRDWLNTIEPRTVRAVMKRVVEDITTIDSQVGALYEEGIRKAHSSDSSRRALSYSVSKQQQQRMQRSYASSSNFDTSLMSNIQKLFSERIEIFSSVEFSKVSILTGIVKISLKTFLECIRLRTFGRYGLQQIQVDTHYLNLYLWRFVSDEKLVHFLLDEVVGSALHRCLDAVLMETSIVEVICDRG